jgi:hypothetical protein
MSVAALRCCVALGGLNTALMFTMSMFRGSANSQIDVCGCCFFSVGVVFVPIFDARR